MTSHDDRPRGVTPGLRSDYASRTAGHQAAFLLPYLSPGMDLLDVGCGPGTITIGLARAVAPGQVTGIDYDREHVEAAQATAAADGVANISVHEADALALPFEDNVFDVVFENNVFFHIGRDAPRAVREVYRVLKAGGLFAARDVDAERVIWGNTQGDLDELDRLFLAWNTNRGSDVTMGRRLPALLREGGFTDTVKSVSADTKGEATQVRDHARIMSGLIDGPFGRAVLASGSAGHATLDRLKSSLARWARHPDSFFANLHIEVVGWKPG